MKCIIAGSRRIDDYGLLDRAFTSCAWHDKITEIVSGTARGVDQMGERLAGHRGLSVAKFPADWAKGRGAGHMRNKQMAEYADIAIVLWDGKSRGTKNMIENMKKLDKPCLVYTVREGAIIEPNYFEGDLFNI
jgi:hypothetical protein